MAWRYAVLLVGALAICSTTPAMADWYDSFNDGEYVGPADPNIFDIDNQPWYMIEPYGYGWAEDANTGQLWLFTYGNTFGWGAVVAGLDNLDTDPNTSPTFWDDTQPHYILSWVRNSGAYPDPNDDRGAISILMFADLNYWETIWLIYEWYHREAYMCFQAQAGGVVYQIKSHQGTHIYADPNNYDANDPNWDGYDPNFGPDYPNNVWATPGHMDEPYGFWILYQFDLDPAQIGDANYSGDPNGKYLRAAVWDGDKYDWNGQWSINVDLSYPNTFKDGYDPASWPSMYYHAGTAGLCTYTEGGGTGGDPTEAEFDNIEARSTIFVCTPRTLTATVINPQYGSVAIEPDIYADCNNVDPNDYDPYDAAKLRRYTDGVDVVLIAEPIAGKSFNRWVIFDPNHPGDANFGAIDSNTTLYLTMDQDYAVEAAFKCGTGLPPFIAMSLLALALGVVIRRLT